MRRPQATFANVTSLLALVVATGGTSYAATQLPSNSVGSAQVKDHSLVAKDVKAGQFLGAKGTAVRAGSATNASKLGGLTKAQLGHATSGTSTFNTTSESDSTTVITTTAPTAGQLQYTIVLTCLSNNGTTASTLWYATPLVDGTDISFDNPYLTSLLDFGDTSPHRGDSTTLTGQVPVGAGTHAVGVALLRATGDGSADCNVQGTTLFTPTGEVNPPPPSSRPGPSARGAAR